MSEETRRDIVLIVIFSLLSAIGMTSVFLGYRFLAWIAIVISDLYLLTVLLLAALRAEDDALPDAAKFWLDEKSTRRRILGSTTDIGQLLDYQRYRLAFRDVASNTNERTMIATVLPPKVFCPHTVSLEKLTTSKLNHIRRLGLVALFNAFVTDFVVS